ncbi:MAG: hypothetical protein P8Z67_06605 [Gammaproteobacteria bacterium]
MQLEKMTAQVRPRPAWEAVDLGFMMLQRRYRQVIAAWIVITLPVFLIINSLLNQHPFWAAFVFWWLLPVYDRAPMHILSRALFGEIVTVRSLLKEWRNVLLPHSLKLLTIYRLDIARSYNLPVWQLEKLSGQERAKRARVLKKSQGANAVGLGFICLGVELVIFFSLYGLIMMFLPNYYQTKLMSVLFHHGQAWWAGPLANSFWYLTLMLVEPFYVAGGFSLYINRRTQLEGWDIEINFRQLAQRVGVLSRQAVLLIGCMLTLQLAGMFCTPTAQAATKVGQAAVTKTATNNAVARQAITEILRGKAFHHREKVGGWRLRHKHKTENNQQAWSGLSWLGDSLAVFGQVMLWVLVAVVLMALVYFFIQWVPLAKTQSKQHTPRTNPGSLFGLDITPESLPDDVGSTALRLWREGKLIEALSLLYRGALTTLVHRDGINLRGSATEGDCIRIVNSSPDKVADSASSYFQALTRQWQYAAYAHRHPDDRLMNELCISWGKHFGVDK